MPVYVHVRPPALPMSPVDVHVRPYGGNMPSSFGGGGASGGLSLLPTTSLSVPSSVEPLSGGGPVTAWPVAQLVTTKTANVVARTRFTLSELHNQAPRQ